MSFLSMLGKIGKAAVGFIPGVGPAISGVLNNIGGQSQSPWGQIAGMAGAGLGAAAQSNAANRGTNIDVGFGEEQMNQGRERLRLDASRLSQDQLNDYYDNSIARETEGRTGRNDAMRGVQQAEYLKNRSGYAAPSGTSAIGFGPKASTDAEKQAAELMRMEVMKRLEGGNPLEAPTMPTPVQPGMPGQYQVDPKLRKPGMFEKIAGVAAPVLAAGSAWRRPAVDGRTPGFGE